MTEHEKMLAGLVYNPYVEGMCEERALAHRLCRDYNTTTEDDAEKRKEILDKLLPNRADGVYLQGPIFFDFGSNISMGKNSYANFNFTVLDEGKVTIGENVFIGPNVSLLCPIHPLRYQDRNTGMERAGGICIQDNCWLGGSVTVCAGVTIGEGSVIGAGSVVTKDIPPHSLAVGNPCRVLREITEADSLAAHPEWFANEK